MSHISESIPDLLGGVSQLAPQRRAVNEVESMVNCQLRPAEGVVKRPPTTWIAEIAADASGFSGALVHTINKNTNERFWVIVLDGDLKVFNAVDGVEVPVSFPDGKSYLDVVASPNEAFRLATFNQTTVIVNRETTVGRSSELSASRGHEALVTVQQTDFDTSYYIFIGFDGPPAFNSVGIDIGPPKTRIKLTIPPIDGGPNGEAPSLSTIDAAFSLAVEISRELGALGVLLNSTPNLLTASLFGSTIHITPGPDLETGAEFWVSTSDDLANQGLQTVQTSVQTIDDLPSEGPEGFRIKVEGDPEKSLDDVFYEFTDHKTWKETAASGIPIAMNPATLPLELIHDADLLTKNFPAQVPTATFVVGGDTEYRTSWLETEDGTASTRAQSVISPAPGVTVDKFLDVTNGNGSAINMKILLKLDQTHIVGPGPDPADPTTFYAGDTHTIEIAADTSGSYLTKFVFIVPFLSVQRDMILDINFGGALFDAGENVRLRVISAAGNKGALTVKTRGTTIFSTNLSVSYTVAELARIGLPHSHYAPGTDMTFTLNGTAFVHDFAAGGTQAAYGAALVTAIEAYGGQALDATFSVKNGRGHIDITNDDDTQPIITNFTFDDNLDLTIKYFNGSADFVNLGVTSGDIIKNLTDVSEAAISGVATTIITHAALAGGTANAWAEGDKGSAKTTALSFTCRQPDWAKRLTGTEETNKWPSFEDETINEVSFLKNRLVLLSDENVAMSEVDKFFNYFRSSTIDLLDSDRIDVALSGNKTSSLHSAFTWNKTLIIWSELGQFVVNGEPFLSPNTVTREATTAYINTRKVKPVTSERAIYFLTEGNEFCQLWDYKPTAEDATSAEGNRLSVQVPRYMPGTPRGLLAVSDPEVVLVLTSTDPEKLYVFSHLIEDQQRIMGSWHEWTFAGVTQILGIGSIDNEVSLVLERDDGKVHLEVLDLWELSETTLDAQEDTDGMTTPPTFGPVEVVQALDLFTDSQDTFLSNHTSDSGFGTWATNVAESGAAIWRGAFCNQVSDSETNKLSMSTSGGSGGYRCSGSIGDGDMHFYIDMLRRIGVTNSFPLGRFLVNAIQAGSHYQKGMGIGIDDGGTDALTKILAKRYHNGGQIESSSMAAAVPHAVGDKLRYGFRRVGLVFSYYTADAGTGFNEVARGSFTMGSISTTGLSELSDGAHKGVHLFTESSQDINAGHRAEWENMTVLTDHPTDTGTTITPDGPGCGIGIDESGNEVTMIDNGDGTCSWPNEDKTGENIIIGLAVASSIVLNKLYHRKNFGPYAGQAEVRGQTYINSLLLGLEDTTTMAIAIAITGHTSFSQDLTEVRSLDAEYMHCRVGGRNTETTITLSSSDSTNFKIVGIDWEGSYFNRTGRMS